MEWPDTRIIHVDLDNNIARDRGTLGGLDKLNITTLGIIGVGDVAIPGAESFGEDICVVTVKMHRMRTELEGIVDYDPNRLVAPEVVDVPFLTRVSNVSYDGTETGPLTGSKASRFPSFASSRIGSL